MKTEKSDVDALAKEARPAMFNVPVAFKFANAKLPEIMPLPCTDNCLEGVEVPTPKNPAEVIVVVPVPPAQN